MPSFSFSTINLSYREKERGRSIQTVPFSLCCSVDQTNFPLVLKWNISCVLGLFFLSSNMPDLDHHSLRSVIYQCLTSDREDALMSFPSDAMASSDRALYYDSLFLQFQQSEASNHIRSHDFLHSLSESIWTDLVSYESRVIESIFSFLIHVPVCETEVQVWREEIVERAIAFIFDSTNDHAALGHRSILFLEQGLLLALKWKLRLASETIERLKERTRNETSRRSEYGLVIELMAWMEGSSPFNTFLTEMDAPDESLFFLTLDRDSFASLSMTRKEQWMRQILANEPNDPEIVSLGYALILSMDPLPFDRFSLLRLASFRLKDGPRERMLYDKIRIIERVLQESHDSDSLGLTLDFELELNKNWHAFLQHPDASDHDFSFLSSHSLCILESLGQEESDATLCMKRRAWTLLMLYQEEVSKLDAVLVLTYFRPTFSAAGDPSGSSLKKDEQSSLIAKLAAVQLITCHSELSYQWIVDWTRYLLLLCKQAPSLLEALFTRWIEWIRSTFQTTAMSRKELILDYAYLLSRGWQRDQKNLFSLFYRTE